LATFVAVIVVLSTEGMIQKKKTGSTSSRHNNSVDVISSVIPLLNYRAVRVVKWFRSTLSYIHHENEIKSATWIR
jgi:hypothetical protein